MPIKAVPEAPVSVAAVSAPNGKPCVSERAKMFATTLTRLMSDPVIDCAALAVLIEQCEELRPTFNAYEVANLDPRVRVASQVILAKRQIDSNLRIGRPDGEVFAKGNDTSF